MKPWTLACLVLFTAPHALASRVVTYEGVARVGDRVAYVEKHAVVYDDNGRPLEAATRYVTESGRSLAELKSDFRESLTVPSYTATDYRSGNVHGLRREGGRLVLFDRDRGKGERTRVFGAADAGSRLLVAGQGLNYYLLANLDALRTDRDLPLRFLIPGKLDYYDFRARKLGETRDGVVEVEVTVQNRLLHLFAPKLQIRYDRRRHQISGYHGLSNVPADDGASQVVTITYPGGAQ